MVIICDISAWQYWRTPPIIKNSEVPLELAVAPSENGGLNMDRALFTLRSNAREAERLISSRILTDLKGLTFPVHVMVDEHTPRRSSKLISCHTLPVWLSRKDIIDLGGGVGVLGLGSLFATIGRHASAIDIAGAMCEACGIYTLFHATKRSKLIIGGLLEDAETRKLLLDSPAKLRYYWSQHGNRTATFDESNSLSSWQPCLKATDTLDDLWRRPPLATLEYFEKRAIDHPPSRGINAFRQALRIAREGLASPLETQCAILLTAPVDLGGENLPIPKFNQQIRLSEGAKKLAGTAYCVGDAVWESCKTIFEANGYAYHADEDGFYIKSGRLSALQNLGYTVHEMNYAQLTDQEQYEAIVQSICSSLNVRMQPRDGKFTRAHQDLRNKIFKQTRFWA